MSVCVYVWWMMMMGGSEAPETLHPSIHSPFGRSMASDYVIESTGQATPRINALERTPRALSRQGVSG